MNNVDSSDKRKARRRVTRRRIAIAVAALIVTYFAVRYVMIVRDPGHGASGGPIVLRHTVTVEPDAAGSVAVGDLLGGIAGALGLEDAQSEWMRRELTWRIDTQNQEAIAWVRKLEELGRGALSVDRDTADNRINIVVDRAAVRRESKAIRTAFREYVRKQFPTYAENFDNRQGLFMVNPGAPGELIKLEDRDKNIPTDPPRHLVVMVHGLDDPGRCWNTMRPVLTREGYAVADFRYPNDQPIRDSAAMLAESLAELHERGVARVTLVCHSMGGLVSREMLTSPDHAIAPRPDVSRLILIGVPNHGSELARLRGFTEFRDGAFRLVNSERPITDAFEMAFIAGILDGTGEAMIDLLPGSEFLTELNARSLPASRATGSPIPITIVAGSVSPISAETIASDKLLGQKSKDAFTLLANGVGDGAVSIRSTKIEGVDDYQVVPDSHLTIVHNPFTDHASSVQDNFDTLPPGVTITLQRMQKDHDATPDLTTTAPASADPTP